MQMWLIKCFDHLHQGKKRGNHKASGWADPKACLNMLKKEKNLFLLTGFSAQGAHLATAPQHIPTQHDMLPQHLVCKYQLNCEYCNITLAKNKAPWWWSDVIETCFKVFYVKFYVRSLVDKF